MKKQTDLFDKKGKELFKREAPLADRMRPRTLDEFVGQDHLLGQGRFSARPSNPIISLR
jgi:putative ATPase